MAVFPPLLRQNHAGKVEEPEAEVLHCKEEGRAVRPGSRWTWWDHPLQAECKGIVDSGPWSLSEEAEAVISMCQEFYEMD